MHFKVYYKVWAVTVLLVSASGCGMEGPVPSDTKGTQGNNDATVQSKTGDSSDNNLKQIGRAMQNYASTFSNAFPPAATVAKGKPPYSWRVKLLPFLGEAQLYREYRVDEAWDSPHNLEVAKKMPKVYQTPGQPDDGKTSFMVFTGKDTALAPSDNGPLGSTQNIPLSKFQDGMMKTILVVEAGRDKAVPWTKPEDLPFDPANPLAALGQIPAEGFLAVMADGSVHRFNVDNATLKALITPAGGEPIDMSKITGGQ